MLKSLYLSLFSPEFYRSQAKPSTAATGFGFLFLASCLSALFVGGAALQAFNAEGDQEITKFIKQTPEITISNGELSIDKQSPYYIHAGGEVIGVIDTSPTYDGISFNEIDSLMAENKFKFLVTKHNLYLDKDNGEDRVINLSEMGKETVKFNSETVIKIYDSYKYFVLAAIPLLLAPFVFIFNVILMFLYSLCGLVVNAILRAKADYSTIQRITCYALWPISVIWYFESILGFSLPTYICIAIICAYQTIALRKEKTA